MDISQILAFARKVAEAIAEGRVAASEIKHLTDEELMAFDNEAFEDLKAAQARNETLAKATED